MKRAKKKDKRIKKHTRGFIIMMTDGGRVANMQFRGDRDRAMRLAKKVFRDNIETFRPSDSDAEMLVFDLSKLKEEAYFNDSDTVLTQAEFDEWKDKYLRNEDDEDPPWDKDDDDDDNDDDEEEDDGKVAGEVRVPEEAQTK